MQRKYAAPALFGYTQPPANNSAQTANANNAFVPGVAQDTAASGSIINGMFNFTPRVSGKLQISWSASGAASADSVDCAFSVSVDSVTRQTNSFSSGGDAGHTIGAAGSLIVSGLLVGNPIAIDLDWLTGSGTFAPAASGGIVVVELAG